MTKYNKYLFLFVSALCILGWEACTQDRQPCLTPKIASLNIKSVRITSRIDTTPIDTALPAAFFVAMTAKGDKGVIYPPQSAFTISLSSVTDSCQWAVTADTAAGNKYDTLTFYYKRQLQFISNACGFAYFYDLSKVNTTHNFIDSLRVTNTSVTNNVNTNHLQVFIHPNFP